MAGDFEKPRDPAEAPRTVSQRVGSWTLIEWMQYLGRNPDACLPSGVGGMLLKEIERIHKRVTAADAFVTVVGQLANCYNDGCGCCSSTSLDRDHEFVEALREYTELTK